MLAIRLSFSYDKLTRVFSKIKDASDKVVVYQHDSARVHVHALIVGCTVSTDTLKNWVRKECGIVPKTDWSFVTAQNEEFITYMSKGNLTPVFVSGYDMDQLDLFRSKWVERPKKDRSLIQYRLKVENPQEQKKRQEDMVKEIVLRYKESGDNPANPTPSVIINLIRQVVVVENRTLLGRYKLRDYYDTVTAYTQEKTWIRHMELFCHYKV